MKSWSVCISIPEITVCGVEAETEHEAKSKALDMLYEYPDEYINLDEDNVSAFDVYAEPKADS